MDVFVEGSEKGPPLGPCVKKIGGPFSGRQTRPERSFRHKGRRSLDVAQACAAGDTSRSGTESVPTRTPPATSTESGTGH